MKIKTFMLAMAAATALFASAQHQGYKDGIDYYKADQFDNAKEILTKTLDDRGTDRAEALYYLGSIELKEGNVAKAKEYFNKGVSANSKNGLNYVGLGAVDLKNGNVSAAEENFKRATKADKRAYIYTEIARAYYNTDKVKYAKEYKKNIDSAMSRDRKDPSIYILQGDVYRDEALASKRDDGATIGKAASEYEQAIHFSNNSPEAYVKYARVYKQVNADYAINRLKELNEIAPNSALAQKELAETYFDLGKWPAAAREYEKYLENPNHFVRDEARYTVLLFYAERFDEGIALAKQILEKEPNNAQAQRMLFWHLDKKKDYENARKAAEVFINAPDSPVNATDYSIYSHILTELGDYDAKIAVLEKAIKDNPDKIVLLSDLSEGYMQAGGRANKAKDTEAAHAFYVKSANALQKFVDGGEYGKDYKVQDLVILSTRYQNAAATAPADSVSNERAEYALKGIEVIDSVIAKVPENVVPYRNRARLYLVKGGNKADKETADAYMLLLEKLDLDPENKTKRTTDYRESFSQIASYYISEKDIDNAKIWYTKMLELDPENDALRTYIDNLGKKKK